MYYIPQTLVRKSDKSLWLYIGFEFNSPTITLFDEQGNRHEFSGKTFSKDFTCVRDVFGNPAPGKFEGELEGDFSSFFGKAEPPTGHVLKPDTSLKALVSMSVAEVVQERTRQLAIMVEKVKAVLDAYLYATEVTFPIMGVQKNHFYISTATCHVCNKLETPKQWLHWEHDACTTRNGVINKDDSCSMRLPHFINMIAGAGSYNEYLLDAVSKLFDEQFYFHSSCYLLYKQRVLFTIIDRNRLELVSLSDRTSGNSWCPEGKDEGEWRLENTRKMLKTVSNLIKDKA